MSVLNLTASYRHAAKILSECLMCIERFLTYVCDVSALGNYWLCCVVRILAARNSRNLYCSTIIPKYIYIPKVFYSCHVSVRRGVVLSTLTPV